MLPSLATVPDLEARLGRALRTMDTEQAKAALFDASTLVRSEVGQTWVDANNELTDIPDIVFTVTLSCARRAMVGETFRGNDLDGTTFVESPIGRPLYLTRAEKAALARELDTDAAFTISTVPADIGVVASDSLGWT